MTRTRYLLVLGLAAVTAACAAHRFGSAPSHHSTVEWFETVGIQVTGHGRGRADGDHLTLDVDWTFPAQGCSGTLHLEGSNANHDTAIIGQLTYVDGCAGGGTKPGTFAMWRGGRTETVVARQ